MSETLKLEEMIKLEQGIELEQGNTALAKAEELQGSSSCNYSSTSHKDRKRQVRRMFAALGHRNRTLAPKKVRIAKLILGDLKEGEV